MQGSRDLRLPTPASGAEQEMFVPVASVCLTRHYTWIWTLGMPLRSGRPSQKIRMLGRALYYIRTKGATLPKRLIGDWLDVKTLEQQL